MFTFLFIRFNELAVNPSCRNKTELKLPTISKSKTVYFFGPPYISAIGTQIN